MKKVLITKDIPSKGVELLEEAGLEVSVYRGESNLTDEELSAKCKEVDLLMNVGQYRLSKTFLEDNKHLKGIALASVGYDHIDLATATALNIPVSNTPDVLSGATADVAFLLMLAVSRKAFARGREILDGKWKGFGFTQELGQELNGKTLGIFGLGRIGIEMAKKAKGAYNMDIIYHNRNRNEEAEQLLGARYVDFDTLLAEGDVISVHTNLSDETLHKFNAEAFKKMKSNAIFINTARGSIHHEADLMAALQNGEIWGAGLDVTDPEPMSAGSPLLQMSNVCVLPHIGSATVETRTAMVEMASKNLIAAISGDKMPQILNANVYK